MFGLFKKDPLQKYNKEYQSLLEQAQRLQRNGDIEGYSRVSAEAAAVLEKIEAIENQQ